MRWKWLALMARLMGGGKYLHSPQLPSVVEGTGSLWSSVHSPEEKRCPPSHDTPIYSLPSDIYLIWARRPRSDGGLSTLGGHHRLGGKASATYGDTQVRWERHMSVSLRLVREEKATCGTVFPPPTAHSRATCSSTSSVSVLPCSVTVLSV